ncbi:MAG: bifunctional DNA-formamidopyrimidine glycosylase/DNA-(apurinic or apyrimidinic site) lyase [Gammaproteobacteria bacterium]|nr:bifunctional DNA-formamidopyrimidine glycosylase/DNA-(apurinic or apyrimidinic site) lyase [Gammaproteobacteria bacterium]
MPELPEVETVRRTLLPHCEGLSVKKVIIRRANLRWPFPANLQELLEGRVLLSIKRRAKYLLFEFEHGQLIIHLGMSGVLKMVNLNTPIGKHDHFDLQLELADFCLRLNDTRRFGAVLWANKDEMHPLLSRLGPEPLADEFNAIMLYGYSHTRQIAIKSLIMDSHIVVGVGNIYANEALFHANIHPETPAKNLSEADCARLVAAIKHILAQAIKQGGTTLKDYRNGEGKPGYFQQELFVYGRRGKPCLVCNTTLIETRLGQRTTVFCSSCQKAPPLSFPRRRESSS